MLSFTLLKHKLDLMDKAGCMLATGASPYQCHGSKSRSSTNQANGGALYSQRATGRF